MDYGPIRLPPASIGLLFAHCVAIISTVVRLAHRFRRQQLYWDDFWAFIALLAAIFVIVIWLYLSLSFPAIYFQPLDVQAFILWVTYFTQPAEIWASRLSIGATVVRLLPPGPTRRASQCACIVFACMWFTVFVQAFFLCGNPMPKLPYCALTTATPLLGLALNLIGDAWLVCWPAYIMLRMKLPKTHRRLLLACFSASLSMIALSIWHAINIIYLFGANAVITGHLQVSVSLFVCNLLVLVTYIYRVFRDHDSGGNPYPSATGDSGLPITGNFTLSSPVSNQQPERAIRKGRRKNMSLSLRSMSLDVGRLASTFQRHNPATTTQMSTHRSGSASFDGHLTTVDTTSLHTQDLQDLSDGQSTDSIREHDRHSTGTGHPPSFNFSLLSTESRRSKQEDEESASAYRYSLTPSLSNSPITLTAGVNTK